MPTKTQARFNSQMEYAVIENAARQKIAEMVDDAFEAYLKAGNPMAEYDRNQFFLNLLFREVNGLEPYSDKRMGGLQLIIRFMARLIEHYEKTPGHE